MSTAKPKTQSSGSAFLGGVLKAGKPADAFFHVLPVPLVGERFKHTAMATAPEAIIRGSQMLETWDGRSNPSRHGIHTYGALDCKGGAEKVLQKLADEVSAIAKADKFPLAIGGDGLVSYGMVKGLLEAGVENFAVVQIDAHADLKDSDNGTPWSEACVMKRIVDEDVSLFQLGVRCLSKEEADARRVNSVKFYDADWLVSRNVQKVELPGEFPDKVYLSIDIDGFDSTVFPSATAIPGGLGWWQVLSIVESISQQADIIGMDFTEYNPTTGDSFHDHAAATMLYRLMGIVERSRL
jgi:agmatinase